MMFDNMHLWAVVNLATNTVEYSSPDRSVASAILSSFPFERRHLFEIVRFDVAELYRKNKLS